ncbi:hypothetical protein QYE76_049576 [Lolium multiflorum]|uniref:Ubiquitin-like protease family profile domain-containing protein n=1 Tax=Lolium multiflorum TaxID=4521 RepID=A0AAD8WG65_LOLMU|nr:hypothetical protein QYE76_020267 [Lolium multiflorum]KAK1661417.1 hypothetical protein QYE76_049576 [Lolium multiflorum]
MARLTVDQRARLALTNLRSMMMIPSVKMRTILIRFMLDVFDPATSTFEIGENNGAVSLGFVDVECLLGLVNEGFSAGEILTEEGEDVKHRIPPQFLSKSTGNIVIDELIDDIIKSKLADDDFLRRVVLVLIGTVLAPMATKIVPPKFYALVEDVERMSKINWNAFTLRVLLDSIRLYLYWEKCQPLEGDCAFNPKLSMRPLMRNWNEAAATRRDNFDYENGRGRGNVKIDENITEEYRLMEPVVPDPVAAPQNNAKPASAVPRKKQAPKPIDNGQTEILINRLTGYLDAQVQKMLATIPALCAQRTLEMFNKEGVTYKPAAAAVSGNMEDQEDVNSFRNGPRDKKEFMYKEESDSARGGDSIRMIDMNQADEFDKLDKKFKEAAKNGTAKNANDAMRTPAKGSGLNGTPAEKPFGDVGSTPDNPFIIENADPLTSDSEIDLDAVTISKFMSKSKEDELAGKRKRTIPKKFQSPYALDRRTKRQVRGSSSKALNFDDKSGADKNAKPDASSDLSPELVDAAIVFLELASRSEQHKKKNVYRSVRGDEVNAERLRVVLDEKWLSDDVIDGYIGHLNLRVGDDRFLCPAWRSKYLVDRANAGDKPKESSKNIDSAMVRSGAVGRVVTEYTVRDKVYFPLNIGNTHWTTVVMHIPKQEFQVLDSLYPLEFTLETVEALRRQIAEDMQVANEVTSGNHPDVSKWPILEYDMPQQHDGNSCGLFVIECMEHWDGDRMTAEISQIKINARRRRVVAEMMLSPSNTLEIVKQKIRSIASRINKKT